MNSFNPENFEEVLKSIKNKVDDFAECDDIRSIESNFNTKGMVYNSKKIQTKKQQFL